MKSKLSLIITFYLFAINVSFFAQNKAVLVEMETQVLGSAFMIGTSGDISFIYPSTDYLSTTNPGDDSKVVSCSVIFNEPGNYDLYVRVRVGEGAYSDDSFYIPSGLGTKSATSDSDWLTVNGIVPVGYSGSNELVDGAGSIGTLLWKWINISEYLNNQIVYTVSEAGTYTFQLGARENGLDIDKIAFGKSDLYYTVYALENEKAGVSDISEIGHKLFVELSSEIREVTHCAAGSLYGLTETLPSNVTKDVVPLKSKMFVQPARSGSSNQQPFGGALKVSERLNGTNSEVMIRLADICPGWPYQWPGKDAWEATVTSLVNEKIASGRENFYGYEIWNEQHGTWQETENGGAFFETLWKPTYDLVRSLDPDAKIVGPSDSYYQTARMTDFLNFCINNNCLPDIICWHELLGSDNVSSNIDSYRLLESSLGISPREISINEYSSATHEYEGCPGVSAPFIARFERKKVHSAAISWWFTDYPGRLGSLLTPGNERGGGWWFYNWYGEMSGNMISVVPPSESGDGVDGFACLDEVNQYASICLGGNNTGTYNLEFSDIPVSFGDNVYVKTEYVTWPDKDTPVDGPVTVSIENYIVTNGSINVDVNIENAFYGYRVILSPNYDIVSSVDDKISECKSIKMIVTPNPAHSQITVSIPEEIESKCSMLKVYNALGELVLMQKAEYGDNLLDISELNNGLYFIQVNINNYSEAIRFIKK